MDLILTVVAAMLCLFLVMSAAVEVILETLRGTLESCGFTWVRSKMTLEEALELASQFSVSDSELNLKAQAMKLAAMQIKARNESIVSALNGLAGSLVKDNYMCDENRSRMGELAITIKKELAKSENRRVFILRLLSAIIGCGLAYMCDFHIFRSLAAIPGFTDFMSGLVLLDNSWINIFVAGLASSAGSSYWHDKLDMVRNLKTVVNQVKT